MSVDGLFKPSGRDFSCLGEVQKFSGSAERSERLDWSGFRGGSQREREEYRRISQSHRATKHVFKCTEVLSLDYGVIT